MSAARKTSAAKKSTPAKAVAGTGAAKSSRTRVAEEMGVTEASKDTTLVEKSSGNIKHMEHGSADARSVHRKGYGLDQEVKSLAHIYTPWANVRANGSGIVAIAAWSKRLAEEGKSGAKDEATKVGEFTRGLTHR